MYQRNLWLTHLDFQNKVEVKGTMYLSNQCGISTCVLSSNVFSVFESLKDSRLGYVCNNDLSKFQRMVTDKVVATGDASIQMFGGFLYTNPHTSNVVFADLRDLLIVLVEWYGVQVYSEDKNVKFVYSECPIPAIEKRCCLDEETDKWDSELVSTDPNLVTVFRLCKSMLEKIGGYDD